jgi:hypothetical protein
MPSAIPPDSSDILRVVKRFRATAEGLEFGVGYNQYGNLAADLLLNQQHQKAAQPLRADCRPGAGRGVTLVF